MLKIILAVLSAIVFYFRTFPSAITNKVQLSKMNTAHLQFSCFIKDFASYTSYKEASEKGLLRVLNIFLYSTIFIIILYAITFGIISKIKGKEIIPDLDFVFFCYMAGVLLLARIICLNPFKLAIKNLKLDIYRTIKSVYTIIMVVSYYIVIGALLLFYQSLSQCSTQEILTEIHPYRLEFYHYIILLLPFIVLIYIIVQITTTKAFLWAIGLLVSFTIYTILKFLFNKCLVGNKEEPSKSFFQYMGVFMIIFFAIISFYFETIKL